MRGGADGGGCFPTGQHYPGIAHLLRVVAAGLAREFGGDHPVKELPLVSIDTETTGRREAEARIVEVACVYYRDGAIGERRSWLINPGCPIPEEAFAIHKISDDDVRDKPRFEEVAPELIEALFGHVPLAYNADFDKKFLVAEFARAGQSPEPVPPALRPDVVWVDPLDWARELQRTSKSKALGEVCARLGIEIGQAHRAADDAAAALKVLMAFWDDPKVPRTYAAFMQEQQRLARRFEEQRKLWRSRQS